MRTGQRSSQCTAHLTIRPSPLNSDFSASAEIWEFFEQHAAPDVSAQDIKLVVPSGLEETEGDRVAIDVQNFPFRVQDIYASRLFQDVPETHQLITEISFRPDFTVTEPRTVTWPDTEWILSTTPKSLEEMNTEFDLNHGANRTTVYAGDVTMTTEATGPSEGPRGFDYTLQLQKPFLYDATEENLVVDIIAPAGYAPSLLDDEVSLNENEGRALLGIAFPPTFGNFRDNQLILQFTFTEPVPLDFNFDGRVDVPDVDMLVEEIVKGTNGQLFDVNGDAVVNELDLDQWRLQAATHNGFAAAYLVGDSNLDGSVNATDLNNLALSWRNNVARWSGGDFTADGVVNALDLNELALAWRQSIPLAESNAAVPEPSSLVVVLAAAVLLLRRRLPC